ncbi:MAG: GspH/FimT family protein [Gammaproteobacteria bacterium]
MARLHRSGSYLDAPIEKHAGLGVTLFELLLVLSLLALITAVSVPMLWRSPAAELKAHAQAVAAGLRRTRDLALTYNRPAAFAVDVNERRFAMEEGRPPYQLPRSIDLVLYTAHSELSSEAVGAIRFFPDGSSTGGRITLKTDKRQYLVDVEWFTGRVRILEAAPQQP